VSVISPGAVGTSVKQVRTWFRGPGVGWFHRADDRARTPLPLGAIGPRAYSEAVRDLSVLAGGDRVVQDELSDRIE